MVDDKYDEIDEEYYEELNKIDFCFNKINESELKDFLKANGYELVEFNIQGPNDPFWLISAKKIQETDELKAIGDALISKFINILKASPLFHKWNDFCGETIYVNECTFFSNGLNGQDIDFTKKWQLLLYKKFGPKYISNLDYIDELVTIKQNKKNLNQNDIEK